MPSEVPDKVQQALLDFDPLGRGTTALYHWGKAEMPNGFVEARGEDCAELKEWATKLGYFTKEE